MKPGAGRDNGPSPEQQDLRAVGVATGLGCSIVAALILCIGGGAWLDGHFGTMPLFTLLGVALGLAVAAYQLWELAQLGSTSGQAGPLSRQLARLPISRAARTPRVREQPAPTGEGASDDLRE
jgi:hypothetical protein